MNRPHPRTGWTQRSPLVSFFSFIFTLTFLVSFPHKGFAADNILGQNIEQNVPSNNIKGQILDKAGAATFQTGFDESSQPAWFNWSAAPPQRAIDPYAGFKEIAYKPQPGKLDLAAYAPSPEDDSGRLMSKAGGILTAVSGRVALAEDLAEADPSRKLSAMLEGTQRLFASAEGIYSGIDAMFADVDRMYAALDRNYQSLEGRDIDQDITTRFNAASDAMAGRAASMARSVDRIKGVVTNTVQEMDAFLTALDHMSKDGASALESLDNLSAGVDEAAKLHKSLTALLDKNAIQRADAADDTSAYFQGQKAYLKSLKTYVQTDGLDQVALVRAYVAGGRSYLEKVLSDLGSTQEKLGAVEAYLNKAKIGVQRSHDIAAVPEGGDVCAAAETKGLKSLRECSKSCRTVCRWKSKEAGNDCYECPSGSPDSCYDVKAWPANHPWCQPGGVCYEDPMMYCAPFGAVGPNLEKLQCTTCKQRPDMCWQKVGDGTTTLTNCKLGCWNGKCVYKGKYQEFEWDGKAENIHCFECKTPPAPPTCEEMGWGYDWENACNKNCPQPGKCEEVTMPGGKKKGAGQPPAGGDKGDPNGGQGEEGGPKDGPQGGDASAGDDTATGGGKPGGEEGGKPTPPTGTPEQPGGGGAVASGPGSNTVPGSTGADQPSSGETPKKPEGQPDTTRPKPPSQPSVDKPEIKDTTPPEPPDTAQTTWLRKWIAEDDAIIEDRNSIIADPDEGDETKAEAARQVESYTKERERLNKWLQEEQDRERARLQKEAEDKARVEAANKERERTRTRWPDPQKVLQEIRVRELKESLDRMKTRLKELQDALAGRREHIDRLTREIELLKKEIKHHKDASESGSEDATHAKNTIAELEKQLAHKISLRNELAQKLETAQRQAGEEFEALKKDYQKKLYAADENARRREDATRTDLYYDKYIELEQTKASRDERNRQFEEKFKDMESRIADAKARGDTDAAGKLQEQLDNMKRGKTDWDRQYETRIKNIEEELYNMGYHDNFDLGVGPTSKETLVSKVNEYAKIVDDQIAVTEKRIAELEQAWKEGKIGTSVRADGSEHVAELDNLKNKLDQLRDSRAAIQEKQDTLKNGYKLPDDIKENIQANTDRYAEGAKNTGPDKSFARLALESLGEEYVHNLNPAVMAKKSLAFAVGVVKGVGTAVAGLGEMAVGMADLSLEAYSHALGYVYGFDGSALFGSDSSEKLYSVLNTVYNNANFDGVIKAVVAAGGALDAEIKRLEKSNDIDWDTSELGGNVAGQTVVGDAVIAGVLGKTSTLLGLTDEAAELANAAKKAENLADDMADASRAAAKAADELPPASALPDSVSTPKTTPHETPPGRGPPAPQVYDNTKPLTTNNRPASQLPETVLDDIEKNQGFRKDHAQRMNEFAQETDTYLIVRDGNPDSVKYFDDPNMMSKPMSSKAKTAKVGPNQGLVVDPTHVKQSQYWDDAIAEAKKAGDSEKVEWLEYYRDKAVKEWVKSKEYMLEHGYRVNQETGVIEYVEKLPDGTEKVITGIHGDYDLHGVYKKNPDGTMESVSFGEGQNFDGNGVDTSGGALRQQLNTKLTGGTKDMVNHGGQDDWIPDPNKIPVKPPDPPVTVFMPDGSAPVKLKTAEEMKDFYENVMGVKWPYPEPVKPVAPAATTAAEAAKTAPELASTTQKFNDVIPPPGTATQKFDNVLNPPQVPPAVSNTFKSNSDLNFIDKSSGQMVQMKTGDFIGGGSTSTVYVNGADPSKVIRITDLNGTIPAAPVLDKAGRQAVETIAKSAGPESSIRIAEQFDQFAIADAKGSQLNNHTVQVVENMKQGTASKIIKDQGGVMTDAQAQAIDRATRQLNENGFAWLDNHKGNYTFEQIEGTDKLRVVIIDSGGIVPMKGESLAQKAEAARAIQTEINVPTNINKFVEGLPAGLRDSGLKDAWQDIINRYGDTIDTNAIQKGMKAQDVQFNPGGLLDDPKAQALFKMTPEEAAKYYGN